MMNDDLPSSVHYRIITDNENGQRLDNYLLRVLKGVPRSHVYRIVRSGEVRINQKRAKPAARLITGDSIRIPPIRTSAPKSIVVSEGLAGVLIKAIIHEDDRFLVINKPAGIAVHGGSGLSLGLIEALRNIRTDLAYLELAHRLDKETSGCLILAKKRSALRAVQALLTERAVEKTYWALVSNPWRGQPSLWVDLPLEKSILLSGERMVKASDQGKASKTYFRVLENYAGASWVEARPTTGRTHQIRVHAVHIGHAIIGDEKYNESKNPPVELKGLRPRMYLHAREIQFTLNDQKYQFKAELDESFARAIQLLGGGGEGD